MNTSRREFFTSTAAVSVGALALAACSSFGNMTDNTQTAWSNFVLEVQNLVVQGAGYVPTIESIAAVTAGFLGPQYVVAVALGSQILNQVVAVLVQVVTHLPPSASARLNAKLAVAAPRVRVTIGVTRPLPYSNGVVVTGYRN